MQKKAPVEVSSVGTQSGGEGRSVDCKKAESLVGRYLNHSLSGQELEEFLEHMETCPSCYEELETCFIVNEATRHLDQEDSESDLDFQELLKRDIRKRKHEIFLLKVKKSAWGTCAFLGGVAALAGAIYLIAELTQLM